MNALVVCGKLFDAVDGMVRNGQCVFIQDGRISVVGERSEIAAYAGLPKDCQLDGKQLAERMDAELIDLSDRFVMPGLIDGHVHIGMDPDTPMSKMLLTGGFGAITVRAIRNAQQDLLAGFTTVRDECCFSYIDVDVRDLIERGKIWGPRLRVAGMCLSSTGGHADITCRPGMGCVTLPEAHIAYIVNGADEARRAARATIKYGADHVKLMASGGVLSDDADPGAQDLLFDEMRAACEVARAHGKPVSAHAHGAQSIKDALRAGVTSIEHGTLIDREGCEALVEHGAYLVPTIIAHQSTIRAGERGDVPPAYAKKARRVMAGVEFGLHTLRELGANIAFGSDAGTSGNHHGAQAGEFALMMEHGSFTAQEVLLAATRVNAAMLGMADEVGSIEAGKRADIVAFPGDPLEDISVMGRCSFVMKGGAVYQRDGVSAFALGV